MRYPETKRLYIIILLTSFVLLTGFRIFGQSDKYYVYQDCNNLNIAGIEKCLKHLYTLRFFYDPDSIPDIILRFESDSILLHDLLNNYYTQYGIIPSIDNSGNVFLIKNFKVTTVLQEDFFKYSEEEKDEEPRPSEESKQYMHTNGEYIAKTVIIGTRKKGLNIDDAIISGSIKEAESNSAIANAAIYVEELHNGTTSNEEGNYNLTLPKGKYTFIISNIENETVKYKVEVLSSGRLDIIMDPKSYLLDEVVISSERHHNVKGSQMGFEKLTMEKIKEIPVVLGERDIIKVALLLPGVQSVGEGSSGFNVRGSPIDQNLFYLNNIPVYNTSHALGFFSAFNADAIESFSLYKSNIPLNFGGRLSSIFDIKAKHGNNEKFSARGGISPITGRLMVEGPIKKNNSSYLVGVRSTYSDWILNLVNDPDIKNSSVRFGDAVAGLSFKLSEKDHLNFFSYGSYDKINLSGRTKHNYENLGASLSWKHYFNQHNDFNLSIVYSEYNFSEENNELDLAAYQQSYKLRHTEIKEDLSYRKIENLEINMGFSSILYQLDRGDYLPLGTESMVTPVSFGREQGLESGVYLGSKWDITPLLELSGGLRFNLYSYLGPGTVYSYLEGHPKSDNYISDTTHYNNFEFIKTYPGLDFRVAAKYLLNENISLKASYNRLHQYIFLLSNTIAVAPTAIWKLSDSHIKPMVGDQFSIGFYTNLFDSRIEASIETYYKEIKNLVEYKDGAEFIVNKIPETDIIQGNLDAYGVEVMLKKASGKLNGWFNYTWSRAIVNVDNPITGENNNFGHSYPANWDKPHAFNLVANYKISRRLSFSGTIVYSTGRPVTYPTAVYYLDDNKVLQYSLRNEYRLPDYFRIDISLTLEGNLLARKLAHGSFTFSVYNLTGRDNAYSVYFRSEDKIINAYKLSIFGVPIFSITYNFKLGNYAD